MLILVTYDVNTQDVAGRRRLNKIAKLFRTKKGTYPNCCQEQRREIL